MSTSCHKMKIIFITNTSTIAQEEESTNQKVGGSIPSSSSPHVKVSLGKILNSKLLPVAVPAVCECV